MLVVLGVGAPLLAGSARPGRRSSALSAEKPVQLSRRCRRRVVNRAPSTSRDEKNALVAGDWLLYPTAFAGAIYDSNPSQSALQAQASGGIRLVPALLAERTVAVSKTSLYAMTDARVYAIGETQGVDAVAARLGAIEDFEPAESWVLHAQGDYTRQRDVFSTLGVTHTLTSLNPTGVGIAPTQQPTTYNQFSGTGSVLKRFSNAFVSVGGTVVDILYDQQSGPVATPSGAVYLATARGGIWISPDVYAFVSGAVDTRNWDSSSLNSSGFRTLVGLGSNQIGLFRGEIYGGYQQEAFDSAAIGTVGSSVYGGHVEYFPYPKLTLRAGADRTIGVSLLGTAPVNATGTAAIVTSVLGQVSLCGFPRNGSGAGAAAM